MKIEISDDEVFLGLVGTLLFWLNMLLGVWVWKSYDTDVRMALIKKGEIEVQVNADGKKRLHK